MMDCNIKELKPVDQRTLVAKLISGKTGNMKSYVAILLVSVGKENFEGNALKSAVKMINQEFRGCCIVIADTLQRYNIASEQEVSLEDVYDESLLMGDAWLGRYESYFSNTFDIPYEILRWDSLLYDAEFGHKEKKFTHCIEQNQMLTKAMEESIEEYGRRLQKRMGEYFNQVLPRHKKNCFSYLKEECIALTLLPKNITLTRNTEIPSVIVYPGKATDILTKNREFLIKEEFKEQIYQNSDFMNWLPYRFNKTQKVNELAHPNLSSASSDNRVKVKEDNIVFNQIEHVKRISEEQLSTINLFLNQSDIKKFYSQSLDLLFNQELLLSYQDNAMTSREYGTINSLACIFVTQMLSLFNTLETKPANQCKAHLIKILKKYDS